MIQREDIDTMALDDEAVIFSIHTDGLEEPISFSDEVVSDVGELLGRAGVDIDAHGAVISTIKDQDEEGLVWVIVQDRPDIIEDAQVASSEIVDDDATVLSDVVDGLIEGDKQDRADKQ